MADRGAPVPPFRKPTPPLDEVAGRPTAEVRDLYLADGFQVETIDVDDPNDAVLAANISPDRIRLFVHAGQVIRGTQG